MPDTERQDSIAQIESAINPQTESAPQASPTEEMLEYYLGDKANKLPLSAMAAFKENGQMNKVPFSQIINGYRINAKTSKQNEELLKGKTQWETGSLELKKYKDQEQTLAPYRNLQDWSVNLEKTNPVAFKYVMDAIEKAKSGTFQVQGQGQPDQNVLHQTISALQGKLDEVMQWKTQFDQDQQEKQQQADRKFIDGEISEHKKKFPEINLDELDASGIPLSSRIEFFGVQNKYQNFTDAFSAFFRDKLPEIFVQRGRSEAVGGLKKDNANGILARSSKPFFNGHPIKADSDQQMLAEFEKIYNR